MTRLLSSGAVITVLVTVATGVASGASPGPSGPPTPVAAPSQVPVDCDPTAAILPPAIDGAEVVATTTAGIAAIDPDDLLDPMLVALGRDRADVCVVVFRYGDSDDALAGQLVRVADTHASDLAGRFVAVLRGAVVAQGGTASPSVLDLDGQTIWSLDVLVEGRDTRILAWQTGDTLLVTSGFEAMERLVPAAQDGLAPPSSMPAETPSG